MGFESGICRKIWPKTVLELLAIFGESGGMASSIGSDTFLLADPSVKWIKAFEIKFVYSIVTLHFQIILKTIFYKKRPKYFRSFKNQHTTMKRENRISRISKQNKKYLLSYSKWRENTKIECTSNKIIRFRRHFFEK